MKVYVVELEFADREDAEKVLEVAVRTIPFDGTARIVERESVVQ